jgi:hypothetical protein
MAGSKSNHLENLVLDLFYGVVPAGFSRPSRYNTLTLHLYTSSPGEATGGTEVTGGSYAALSITNDGTNFPAASNGVKTNGAAFTFTTFTGSVGTIVGWAIKDSDGNRLHWGDLDPADQKAYVANDQFTILVGQLSITED